MKIIASDYDGTLNQNCIVSESDINSIKKWQNENNLFGLITGRGYSNIIPEINYHNIPFNFIVCNNGCEIYDSNKQLVYRADSSPEILLPLCELIIKHKGLHIAISSEQKRHCLIYEGQNPISNNDDVWIEKNIVPTFSYFTQVDTHFDNDEKAEKFAEIVNLTFSDSLEAFNNGLNVDIVPKGVSKTHGIEKLTQIFGVEKQNVFTVGDNFNDLPMLIAYDGYVIESGNPKVVIQIKNHCKNISDMMKKI